MDDQTAVARLLLEHWDPIGVAGIDEEPESEYLNEARDVVAVLRQAVDPDQVAEVLASARLGGTPDQHRTAAAAVMAWWHGKRS